MFQDGCGGKDEGEIDIMDCWDGPSVFEDKCDSLILILLVRCAETGLGGELMEMKRMV